MNLDVRGGAPRGAAPILRPGRLRMKADSVMTRMFLGALVVLMLGVTAPSALAAATSYAVTVSLAGAGNLTDAAGINCSRSIAGVTSGTCSSSIAPECDTSGLKPV